MSHPNDESPQKHDDSPEKDADPTGGEYGEGGAYPEGDPDAGPSVEPAAGGYANRDPATDMPAIPSAPETQGEPEKHAGDPDDPKPRQASD